jgi:hypothetical protein
MRLFLQKLHLKFWLLASISLTEAGEPLQGTWQRKEVCLFWFRSSIYIVILMRLHDYALICNSLELKQPSFKVKHDVSVKAVHLDLAVIGGEIGSLQAGEVC